MTVGTNGVETTSSLTRVSSRLSIRDHLGRWRMRWNLGRNRYRVEPGLYRLGEPGPDAPVLVTANYKLTFDEVRSQLGKVDAFLLVLDTDGVNVWCAAGKGTFGTEELLARMVSTRLSERVSHRRLVLPQLGATGVAAHEVRERSGFRVVWGPVRARDLPAFLASGMRADESMRRVSFGLGDRLKLIGVELVFALRWFALLVIVLVLWPGGEAWGVQVLTSLRWALPVLVGVLTGTILVPLLLPWLPGRAFSLKGGLLGATLVSATLALDPGVHNTAGKIQLLLLGTAAASFFGLQFTGATTFTSPSGVEWEMRRSLGWHLAAVVLAVALIPWAGFP